MGKPLSHPLQIRAKQPLRHLKPYQINSVKNQRDIQMQSQKPNKIVCSFVDFMDFVVKRLFAF
jgi:hypothetical protein